MPIPYASVSDCVDIIPTLGEPNENGNPLEAALAQSLLDASRLIESELMAPIDYFKPAPTAVDSETDKIIYSRGTQRLNLPPFTSPETLTVRHVVDDELIEADSYDIFMADVYHPTGYFLKWNYFVCGGAWGWSYGKVKVKARWGFSCIPPDINVAVKNMGCLMYLVNPQNRLGQSDSSLTEEQETRLRNTYNRILASWQDRFFHRNLGI